MEEKGGEPKGRRLRAKAEERRKAGRELGPGPWGGWWTEGRRLRAKAGERRKRGRELGPGLKGGWWTEWEAPPLWHWEADSTEEAERMIGSLYDHIWQKRMKEYAKGCFGSEMRYPTPWWWFQRNN
jgi:hypothetical protein